MSNYTQDLIKKFKEKYKLDSNDFWDLTRGGKSTWIIKHNALEKIAAQEKYTWKLDVLNFSPDVVVKCIAETNDEEDAFEYRVVESLGESSSKNTMNSYPYAMAEKRAVDRCILKLLNAHAYLYSESEADEFKKPSTTKMEAIIKHGKS
jgi:hypothetical protein